MIRGVFAKKKIMVLKERKLHELHTDATFKHWNDTQLSIRSCFVNLQKIAMNYFRQLKTNNSIKILFEYIFIVNIHQVLKL